MAFPTLTALGDRFYQQFSHLEVGDPENGVTPDQAGYPWAWFCAALAAPLDALYDLFALSDQPWDLVFDLDNVPAWVLPWLSNFTGADPSQDYGPEGNRITQQQTGNAQRGSAEALAGAVRQLPGMATARVVIRERFNPDTNDTNAPYDFQVVTYAAETPDADAVLRVLKTQKVGGYRLHYTIVDGWVIQEMLDSQPTIQDLLDSQATITDLLTNGA